MSICPARNLSNEWQTVRNPRAYPCQQALPRDHQHRQLPAFQPLDDACGCRGARRIQQHERHQRQRRSRGRQGRRQRRADAPLTRQDRQCADDALPSPAARSAAPPLPPRFRSPAARKSAQSPRLCCRGCSPCVLTAHAPVQVNRPMSQTTTDDSRITLHARLRNSPVRRSTLRRTLDIKGRRYGGSSITNAADSPGNNVFRRICAISAASEIPSAQRAKIIHAPPEEASKAPQKRAFSRCTR